MKLLLFLILLGGLWGCLGPGINPGNQSTTPADPDGGVLGPISLNSFTPSVGPQGTKLTITGSNFSSGISVTVGETACTDVAVTSSELLTCTVGGNSPGQQTVTVTSTGGVSTSFTSKFTSKVFLFVISGPTILKIRSYDIKSDGSFPTALETTTQTDPEILAIHPEGKFLYVIPSTSNDFASYTIDTNTGALTELQGTVALNQCNNSHKGTIAANGKFLILDCDTDGIRSFPINQTDGTLGTTAAATTNLSSGNVIKMTTSEKGKFVHILTSSSKLESFELNSNTGALTSLGSPVASDYNSASKLLSLLDSFLYFAPTNASKLAAYSIANNGVPSLLVNSNLNSTPNSFDITSDGRFLYSLDQTNGILKGYSLSSGGSPTYSGDFTETINTGSDLTVGPGNTFVFAGDTNQSKIFSYTVNKSDGSLTEQSSTAIDISPVRFFIK